jgi:hypothetical protein
MRTSRESENRKSHVGKGQGAKERVPVLLNAVLRLGCSVAVQAQKQRSPAGTRWALEWMPPIEKSHHGETSILGLARKWVKLD